MLALSHILLICGLIVLPADAIDPAIIIGQKGAAATATTVGDGETLSSSNPLKIVLPVLYGVQWCAWCVSLICLVTLRLAIRHPAAGLETQETKQQLHTLEMSQSQSITSNNTTSRNQHLFNFRQSVISPLGSAGVSGASSKSGAAMAASGGKAAVETVPATTAGMGSSRSAFRAESGEGRPTKSHHKGKEAVRRYSHESMEMPQIPTRAWAGCEKRLSVDASAIYIPNDSRISQVLVTFREDATAETSSFPSSQAAQPRESSAQTGHSQESHCARSTQDATTIYITNHNYGNMGPMDDSASSIPRKPKDRFTLNFSSSGESLSDMIFKSSKIAETHFSPTPTTGLPASTQQEPGLERPDEEDEETLSRNRSHVTENYATSAQNYARIRATETKASLTLSSDSSSGTSALSNTSSLDGEDPEDLIQQGQQKSDIVLRSGDSQEGIVANLALVGPEPEQRVFPIEKSGRDSRRENYQDSSPDSTPESVLKQFSYPVIPTRRSSYDNALLRSALGVDHVELAYHGVHPHQYIQQNNSDIPDESQPAIQPNSSDSSHSISSISTTSTKSKSGGVVEGGHTIHNHIKRKSVSPIAAVDVASVSEKTFTQPASVPTSTSTSTSASAFEVSATKISTPINSISAEQASTSVPFSPSLVSVPVAPSTSTSFAAAAVVVVTAAPTTSASARSKPSLASLPLRYWRDRTSTGPSGTTTQSLSSISSMGQSATDSSSTSFTQNYLTNTFSKKKKPQIPTIVIHPDEDDGEPPRVLSQKDIEYLTTMPPAPLRPLIQPWDEVPEDDPEYMINEGYDYDDFHDDPIHHQQHHHGHHSVYHIERKMSGIEEEEEYEYEDDGMGDEMDEDEEAQQHRHYHGFIDDIDADNPSLRDYGVPNCDPYALDVPLDLEIDFQGLEHSHNSSESPR
ncbi:hypothetical protein BG004_001625 [Podila humilis]|nr:hypothetical protein BG004_001625 [Podila humilis]